MGEGPNETERQTTMSMGHARHQMPASAGRTTVGGGEAASGVAGAEAWHGTDTAGPGRLVQVLARENMQRAWKRVKAHKGNSLTGSTPMY